MIVDLSDVTAKIAEIDENLVQNELTVFEQGKQLAERKELYLQLYPETAAGIAGGKAGGNGREKVASDTMSFATDAANKTGKSKRTIERKTRIGESLRDIEDDIIEAGLDDSQTDLSALARIKDKSPEKVNAVLAQVIGVLNRPPQNG